jgi:SH3-like domain-containing protein
MSAPGCPKRECRSAQHEGSVARVRRVPRVIAAVLAAGTLCAAAGTLAAEFRSTGDAAVIYDAPSAKSKPLFVLGRDTPLEVIVPLEGWVKVRDAGGTIGWIDRKSLSDKRMVVVRTPTAEVFANPDPAGPLVFRAEQNVLLELAEPATSAAATASPGWVKVKHRDGQTGYIRIAQVFGI